jgi:spore coat polysaccharide biosynthesis predicted glycosyltransferase SpsG
VGDDLQRHDAHAMLGRAAGVRPDAIIVDTYLLGAAWQRSVRDAGVRVIAFDDLADRRVDADIVVNAAGEQSDYQALAPGARHLLGLEYAIAAAPPAEPPDFHAHGAMLVSFGASDSGDLTSQVIAALEAQSSADKRFRVWVQLGEAAPHRNRVLERVKTLPWMQLIKPTDLVDAKGRAIVIAIGASGVSLYERMRDGIPSVVVPLAANQRRIASAAASTGAAMVASGPGEAVAIAMRMLESPQLLKSMSSAGRNAVDGLGAQRVADTILSCIG